MKIPTVRIRHPDRPGETIEINADEFDAAVHTRAPVAHADTPEPSDAELSADQQAPTASRRTRPAR